jgi:Lrp/AsnC family leucine-responsive transcriptional regulator
MDIKQSYNFRSARYLPVPGNHTPDESAAMELTDLDHQIMDLLKENARRSNREIGRLLDSNYLLVGERIKLLEENGLMHVLAVSDLRRSGFDHLLHLEIKVEGRPAEEVAEELAEFDEILAVSMISGQFEIVALLAATDLKDLQQKLETDIGAIKGIRRLLATLSLDVLKFDFDAKPLA